MANPPNNRRTHILVNDILPEPSVGTDLPERLTKTRAAALGCFPMLCLHIEYYCEFSNERLELMRAAGTPVDKLLRERLVRRRIEESNGAPTLRFLLKNR